MPRPTTEAIASAHTICGKARKNSVTRISTSSARRPAYPITSPASEPTESEIRIRATAAVSVGRAPWTTRAQRSRPFSSVPNGWARLGALRRSVNTMALGSRPVKSCGASVMPAASARVAAAPSTEGPPRRIRGRRIARATGSALPVHVVVAEGDAVAEVDEALDVLARDELVDDAAVDDEGRVAPHDLGGLA